MSIATTKGGRLALLRQRRAEVQEILGRFGATRPRVVGSTARGEDRPDSDIDLLLDLPDKLSLLDIIGLELDLGDLLGCRVEVMEEDALSEKMAKRVRAEAIPL